MSGKIVKTSMRIRPGYGRPRSCRTLGYRTGNTQVRGAASRTCPPRRHRSHRAQRSRRHFLPRCRSRPSLLRRCRRRARSPWPAPPIRPGTGPGWRCSSRRRSLYLWGLGASGWANSFYSAAVQAGTKSWKAFFFGSFDAGELHHRRQAAGVAVGDGAVGAAVRRQRVEHPRARRRSKGVAAVGVLYATRASAGSAPAPGSSPALSLALTPVAALMFRFNNPDALLVLLLAGAAYAVTRALETAGTGWLRARRRARRLRVPDQDAAGVRRPARLRPRLPDRRADRRSWRRIWQHRARWAWRCSSRAGWWVAIVELVAGVEPALHRRLAEQQRARPDLRLQRLRPAHRQRDRAASAAAAATPARVGPDRLAADVQHRASAARSRGCCRRR